MFKQAFTEGYEAYEDFLSKDANPHKFETDEYFEWNAGWESCKYFYFGDL